MTRTPQFPSPILVAALAVVLSACAGREIARPYVPRTGAGDAAFVARFTGATLRFDYYHSGTATEEHVSVDRFRVEGPWAGSQVHLVDPTGGGKYRFRVLDPESGDELWTRGFASIYGEWETTGEAREVRRTFHESQRFPEPRRAVDLALDKRGADGRFATIWTGSVDPQHRSVDRSPVAAEGRLTTIVENGPPHTKVDLLFVGEGYTDAQRGRFLDDVRRLTRVLFDTEPWRRRRSDFNVRALQVPSQEPGISNPRAGVWKDTPLGLSFNAFDSDRYVLTYANRELREAVARAPYDALILTFNDRKYGGGGIYNLWCTNAAGSAEAPYLLVHELGHSFAGLADEYYTSPVSYEEFTDPGFEPWEPNVTALLDPAALKWRDLVEPGTPLPTPWDQAAYDEVSLAYQAQRQRLREEGASEEAMEALFREVADRTRPMLEAEPHYAEVGAFEGAAYEAKGLYRPEADCLMFTRNPNWYCAVCTRALERTIDLYVE